MTEGQSACRVGISPSTLRAWLQRGNGEDDKKPTIAQRQLALT